MKLSEFIKKLQTIESQMGSHPDLDDSLRFFLGDRELKIEEVEADSLFGCNCWVGAIIEFEDVDE